MNKYYNRHTNEEVEVIQWEEGVDAKEFLLHYDLPFWNIGYYQGDYGIVINTKNGPKTLREGDYLSIGNVSNGNKQYDVITPQIFNIRYNRIPEEEINQLTSNN